MITNPAKSPCNTNRNDLGSCKAQKNMPINDNTEIVANMCVLIFKRY